MLVSDSKLVLTVNSVYMFSPIMLLTRFTCCLPGTLTNLTGASGNRLYHSAISPAISQLLQPPNPLSEVQHRDYAKRKGFRIKRQMENLKRARARKKEPPKKKKSFFFDSSITKLMVKRFDDSELPVPPPDNVFYEFEFKRRAYKLEEILEMHRESHHPTIFNDPNGLVGLRIECSMKTKKKSKFMERFSGTVTMPHPFELERKTRVAAIVKDIDAQEAAKAAGASIVGGLELIKNLKTGLVSLSEFDHLLCHSEMLIPLTDIRGLLGDAFPNKFKGNFGTDIVALTRKFLDGYDYTCKKSEVENDFGFIDIFVGRLQMSEDKIRENILAVFEDAEKYRIPESPGQFLQRVWVSSPPSKENFLLSFWDFSDYKDLYPIEESTDQVRVVPDSIAARSSEANL